MHRGQHQHALLNLASFHYATGGLDSARSVRESMKPAHRSLLRLSTKLFGLRERKATKLV